MKNRTRITGLLLCLILLFGIATAAPVAVSAAENAPTQATEQTGERQKVVSDKVEAPNSNSDDSNKTGSGDDTTERVLKDTEASEPESTNYVEGEVIVVMDDEKDIDKLEEKADVDVDETITIGDGKGEDLNYAVVSDKDRTTDELIEDLSKQPGVESVIPNVITTCSAVTNDPYSAFQWALQNTGQNAGITGVDLSPEATWSKSAANKRTCVVAVLDTGIDASHPDLKSVLWKNTYRSLPGYGLNGYDYTGTIKNHTPKDDNGHGSHVAGIIAAAGGNNTGISGINKRGVKIMALKVLDKKGEGTVAKELKAFEYVIKARKLGVNVRAVNCSFGGFGPVVVRNEFDKVINKLGSLGVVTCVSAGNEDKNINAPSNGECHLPGSCTSKYCLTVGATDVNGHISSYSNYGNRIVDIAAPGSDILSTVSYNCFLPSVYSASTRSNLCAYYQGFDTGLIGFDDGLYYADGGTLTLSENESYSRTTLEFNGTTGRSLGVSIPAYNTGNFYAFELPFSLDYYSDNYVVSATVMCRDKGVEVGMYDIPQGGTIYDGPMTTIVPNETWSTMTLNIKPNSTSKYQKGYSRRVGFIIYAKQSPSKVYFDHIAISKQGVSTSKFGKYNYLSGTSMAAPYVTGAVALLANAYPTLNEIDIINALKKASIKKDNLKSFIIDGRLLDLKNIAKYAKSSYKYSAPKIKTLENTAKGVRLKIAKVKGVSRYRVFCNTSKGWVKLGDTKSGTFIHKGVKSNRKYTYTVRCVSSNGKTILSDYNRIGWGITFFAAPKAPAVKNIVAGVRLTFKPVSGVARYRIFRKTGNGAWKPIAIVTKNTKYFIDRTVKKGGRYRYTLRCMNKNNKYISGFNNGSYIWRVKGR